jgi:hypothetical protein
LHRGGVARCYQRPGTLSLTISGSTLGGIINSGELKHSVISITYSDIAIANTGIATFMNSEIADNRTDSGGLIINGGMLTIKDSNISGNFADFSPGGILNRGTLTIRGSSISDNVSNVGGEIVNYPTGTLSISDSVVSGNSSARASPIGCGALNNQGTATIKETADSWITIPLRATAGLFATQASSPPATARFAATPRRSTGAPSPIGVRSSSGIARSPLTSPGYRAAAFSPISAAPRISSPRSLLAT